MATYGFKLLRMELHEGKRQRLLDFGNPMDSEPPVSYLDLVEEDIRLAIERRARDLAAGEQAVESPTLSPGVVEVDHQDVVRGSENRADPRSAQMTVIRFDRTERRQNALLIEAYSGKVDDHSKAVHPDGTKEDVELANLATTRVYRALMIAPREGTRGFVAVETISRSHVGVTLPRRLFQGRYRHECKIRLMGPVADEASVAGLLESTASQVEIERVVVGGDSKSRRDASTKLVFKLGKNTSDERSVFTKVRDWIPTPENVASRKRLDSRNEAQAIVSMLWPGLEEATFDDPVVTLQGRFKKKLGPLDMKEGFVYDLGDTRLSDDEFVDEVRETVDRILTAEDVDLDTNWSSKLPPLPGVGGSS